MATKKPTRKKGPKKGMISTNETVAENRKARHDYTIEEVFEAGLVLTGTEVKSLRLGQCSLAESHAGEKNGAIYLLNAHIPEYLTVGSHLQHEVRRPRKLLIKKREQDKLLGAVNREGYTLIPLKIYFNERGLAKLSLALAKGKKQHDKRDAQKERDWNRQKQRLLREKG